MMKDQELERLARRLADTVKGVRPARVRLRVVEPPAPTLFDSITRESCLRRIRFLTRHYQLGWLVEQETFDTPGVASLPDERIASLLRTLERARECIVECIPFEDAGLVANTARHLPLHED